MEDNANNENKKSERINLNKNKLNKKLNLIMKTSGEISLKSLKKNDDSNNSNLPIKYKKDLLKLENPIFTNNLKDKKEKIKADETIIKFNDYELNTLPYNEAIKYDKRTYTQFYLSLLKTKHMLLFSFCLANDYNSKIIKIYLFFYSFVIYYTINALFFGDSVIHKIYEDGGSFNFIYQIPQIIYSSLISSILSVILKALSLTERSVLNIKHEKKNYLDNKVSEVLKFINYKSIIFFLVTFILLLFFWYYLACFCAIYQNTQLHLIKDSVISFGLSMLYAMGLYLLPGIFRMPALRDKNANKEIMYKFSKIIQLF